METTKLIEQYLDGTLNEDEKSKFEEKTAQDSDFKNLVTLHKEVNESIRDNDLSDFHTLLTTVSEDYFPTANKTISLKSAGMNGLRRNKVLRLAAILILVASTGLLLKYSLFRHVGAEELFKQYYMAYDADGISRSAGTEVIALESAIIAYSSQDYSGALIMLNDITRHDTENYLAWFYRGLACLGTNATDEAIQSFNEIPLLWNSPFVEHRDWYLALALLRHGDISKASAVFDRIDTSGGYYAKRAAKVSKKIRS